MANVRYTLFGKEYIQSQSVMMTHIFEELLKRHPESLDAAVEQFSCLTALELSEKPEALRTAPNAFLSKHSFSVNGKLLYIGTAYDLQRKLLLISRLFKLLGEDEQQFSLDYRKEIAADEIQENRYPKPLQLRWNTVFGIKATVLRRLKCYTVYLKQYYPKIRI